MLSVDYGRQRTVLTRHCRNKFLACSAPDRHCVKKWYAPRASPALLAPSQLSWKRLSRKSLPSVAYMDHPSPSLQPAGRTAHPSEVLPEMAGGGAWHIRRPARLGLISPNLRSRTPIQPADARSRAEACSSEIWGSLLMAWRVTLNRSHVALRMRWGIAWFAWVG